MNNVLTVDVEDFFHVEAFSGVISRDSWNSFKPRVERNTMRVLDLFAKYDAKATFFVLGWVAERFPSLTKRIVEAGHEVGSHGYGHSRVGRLTPKQFRSDIAASVAILEDQVQQPILCYRAPSFSVVNGTLWALDILVEEGFRFDSSIFPVRHDVYGIPDADRFPHWRTTPDGRRIFEFPPSTRRLWNNNIGVAGGGYLRLLPYWITSRALKHLNNVEGQPGMVYFHPWEVDPDQPVVPASLKSTLRHYTNLSRMENRIERLLKDFRFTTFTSAARQHPRFDSPRAGVDAACPAPLPPEPAGIASVRR